MATESSCVLRAADIEASAAGRKVWVYVRTTTSKRTLEHKPPTDGFQNSGSIRRSALIDPSNVTRFDRTQEELQEYLLFCIVVAGKTASTQAKALERFLAGRSAFPYLASLRTRDWHLNRELPPAHQRRQDESMRELVEEARLGQYERITRAFWFLGDLYDDAYHDLPSYRRHWILNLHTVQPADLETIPGVGPKTARYFVLHTQRNAQVAALDTHLLKFLAAQGVSNVPRSTPTGKEYARLEQEYLSICRRLDVNPAQFDLAIWRHYAEGYDHMRAVA